MPIKQQLILAISECGKREQNEDFIVPNSADIETHVYVVCDGVGGHQKGEIASKIVAESVEFYLKKKNPFLFQNRLYLDSSLEFAEERLSEYINSNPESKGMATTIVCLEFVKQKVLAYWVGDSKLYHFRKGKILFESKDHTLYQEFKDNNAIDQKDLDEYPFKNYILKAVKGSHKPIKPDYYISGNLQEGDFFTLLTDGASESIKGEHLGELIEKMHTKPTELKQEIDSICKVNTEDNYSIQIIKLLK